MPRQTSKSKRQATNTTRYTINTRKRNHWVKECKQQSVTTNSLSTRALFSSRKLFTSFMFFSLNMKSAEALSLILGARTLYFCVDKIHEMALCLPRVNNPCKILEYLTNLGSSAKSSTTITILNNSFCLFFFWKSITLCCVSIICFNAIGLYFFLFCVHFHYV